MKDEKIISALIGLVGAINNNGKTQNTDKVIANSLLFIEQNPSCTLEQIEHQAKEITQEKFRISPDCETCKAPCGNTSDYDMQRFYEASPEVQRIKLEMIQTCKELVRKYSDEEKTELPEIVYKALAYLGFDMQPASYEKLIEEMNENKNNMG